MEEAIELDSSDGVDRESTPVVPMNENDDENDDGCIEAQSKSTTSMNSYDTSRSTKSLISKEPDSPSPPPASDELASEPFANDESAPESFADDELAPEPPVDNEPASEPPADNEPTSEPPTDNEPASEPPAEDLPMTTPPTDDDEGQQETKGL